MLFPSRFQGENPQVINMEECSVQESDLRIPRASTQSFTVKLTELDKVIVFIRCKSFIHLSMCLSLLICPAGACSAGLAVTEGLGPSTPRLTAECSTIELRNHKKYRPIRSSLTGRCILYLFIIYRSPSLGRDNSVVRLCSFRAFSPDINLLRAL